ncbi:MAG: hypothetical protein NC123_16900 [Butyrivibrio sp.]|nr:hypothetical protein [Ruminococcus flavefaciens]MCM1561197.1 hypothetical protein [Butyrivibrio sp.]
MAETDRCSRHIAVGMSEVDECIREGIFGISEARAEAYYEAAAGRDG